LGTQYLLCEEEGMGGVLAISCELVGPAEAPAPEALRLTAVARRSGSEARTLVQEIGFDGRLRFSRAEGQVPGPRGARRPVPDGETVLTRKGDVLERVVRVGGEEQRDELAWSDQVLPGLIVGFVMTQLHDQGVPDDFTFFLFNGVSLEDMDTRLTSGGLDEEGRRILSCVTQAGNVGLVRYNLAVVNEGARAGELLGARLDVWSRKAPFFRVATAEEAEALLEAGE
jgi:hypothetical protein